jgi:hypothetical protein
VSINKEEGKEGFEKKGQQNFKIKPMKSNGSVVGKLQN